jgi:hypothetical protein
MKRTSNPTPLPSTRGLVASLLTLAFLIPGCDEPHVPGGTSAVSARPSPSHNQLDLKQRQMAFLNRIRSADPQAQTIERAMLNDQNELGLILDRSVEMDKISALMRAMLTRMAAEFPGEDLTVLAYTPSNPPRKIGTGRLNARTRDMTYTPDL